MSHLYFRYYRKKSESCSVMFNSVSLWTAACQDPLSMEFSRKGYWCELPCPSPGDLPNIGVKPRHCKHILYGLSHETVVLGVINKDIDKTEKEELINKLLTQECPNIFLGNLESSHICWTINACP